MLTELNGVPMWALEKYQPAAVGSCYEQGLSPYDRVPVPGASSPLTVERWQLEAAELAKVAVRLRALRISGLVAA